jgi:hypothetical protein
MLLWASPFWVKNHLSKLKAGKETENNELPLKFARKRLKIWQNQNRYMFVKAVVL